MKQSLNYSDSFFLCQTRCFQSFLVSYLAFFYRLAGPYQQFVEKFPVEGIGMKWNKVDKYCNKVE